MLLKIEYSRPPNYDAIYRLLPDCAKPGVIFTYGDTIYNPSRVDIPESIYEHEAVHSKRQLLIRPEIWWTSYLTYPQFRFDEELLAHRRELEVVVANLNRHDRRVMTKFIAKRLASPLYGSLCSAREARKLIQPLVE